MAGLLDSFDIVVKDEGNFKSVFFNSKRAKAWAKKNKARNDSANPARYWKIDLTNGVAKKVVKALEKDENFTVFEM